MCRKLGRLCIGGGACAGPTYACAGGKLRMQLGLRYVVCHSMLMVCSGAYVPGLAKATTRVATDDSGHRDGDMHDDIQQANIHMSCHLLQATATALHTACSQAQWGLSATREHTEGSGSHLQQHCIDGNEMQAVRPVWASSEPGGCLARHGVVTGAQWENREPQ